MRALPLLFVLLLAGSSCHGAEKVGILVEKDFPVLGGAPALSPAKAAATLRAHGIEVTELSARELGDAARLRELAMLVLWSGNAFPAAAQTALRAYHAGGGAFVLNGIPFTHPCLNEGGRWRDLGHQDAYLHHGLGIGTGGFGGPVKESASWKVPANPLGITAAWLPREPRLQWLDPRGLPPGDQIIPLVEVDLGAGNSQPAAAILQHHCEEFPGAFDVWLGQLAAANDEAGRFLAEQLLVRSVSWLLAERGSLTAAELAARYASLDQLAPPGPYPRGWSGPEPARPWGDTFLPKAKPPARYLLAIEFSKLPADERIALTCLQGLTSREQPRLWLLREPADRFWLEELREQGHIDGFETLADWTTLLATLHVPVRGAVIADPQLYRGELIAINVAAVEDALVATPALAARLGLPILLDLRGKFTTYAAAQRWLWATYKDRLSRHLADYCAPRRIASGTWAYQYQWRAPLIWPCGPKDEVEPGADRLTEKRATAEMFAEMVPNSPLLGFPYGGEGIGLGEPPGVELASRYGRPLICSDYLANLCVTSGVVLDRLAQPAPPPAPPLERNKVYIALALSDGDNLNAWLSFFRKYFDHPSFGQYPLAFGMGPALREVMPEVAQWYFARATPRNEIFCDVSGAGYIQPPNYGLALPDPEEAWAGFLHWTARLLPPLGMRTIRPVEGDDRQLARYAAALPFCHSIFADMGCYSGHRGLAQLTYTLPGGLPVFRAATTWRKDTGGLLGEVRAQVGTQRPAFVNAFVHCWTFGPEDLAKIVASADPDMVFVTPGQLAEL